MATEIVMPNLGFDTQEARLVRWVKQVGDSVTVGEVIAVVESDKADVELESIATGTVLEHLVEADTVVAVGSVIAQVGDPDTVEAIPSVAAVADASAKRGANISPVARRYADQNNIDTSRVQGSGPGGRVLREDIVAQVEAKTVASASNGNTLALPKVRRAAREAGISLADVPATGSRGQVTMDDLEAFRRSVRPVPKVPQPPAAGSDSERERPDRATVVELTRARQVIGERLQRSMRDAPHFYVSGEFDLESALAQIEELPQPAPRVNDLLQYLTVQTLIQVPELNATFDGTTILRHESINLAIAVAHDDNLLTPVIQKADRYSLRGLSVESTELIQRTRTNKLRPNDLQGGTFTISNLGVQRQVDQFTAVINPPQVAILAIGTVKPRPLVIAGGLHIRRSVHLTLSGDHRVVDGIVLARFLAAFQDELDTFNK